MTTMMNVVRTMMRVSQATPRPMMMLMRSRTSMKRKMVDQCRQNVGETSTSNVKISSLPSSIAQIQTHLEILLMSLKLVATSPSPGPRLLRLAAIAENAVT